MNHFYAHSLEGQPPDKWQPLDEHLQDVARMAAEFAKPFGGEDWAYLAGLWHDAGINWQFSIVKSQPDSAC